MWRATVLVAGVALTLGGLGATDVAAQGRGNGKAKASDRFEQRDDRTGSARRGTDAGQGVTRDTRETNEPWYRRNSDPDRRNGDVNDRDRYPVYERRGDIYDRNDRNDRYESRAQGPAFCRSGAGHPVWGRQWCNDKGYGLGSERWSRVGWDNVVFRRPDRRYDGRISGAALQDILGRTIYTRLVQQSNSYGLGALNGRWLDAPSGPRILVVHAGPRPLAEFYDRNRDGRVDLVMLNRIR
jgi:hypothetical protein